MRNIEKHGLYGDTMSAKLLFYPRDTYRTEIAADFATDCLRKVGFTNVETHKENDKFTCAAHATIDCEYDIGQHRVKKANVQDIQALMSISPGMGYLCWHTDQFDIFIRFPNLTIVFNIEFNCSVRAFDKANISQTVLSLVIL